MTLVRRVFVLALLSFPLVGLSACRSDSRPDASREGAYQANNLGVARLEQFQYPEAAEAFRLALERDPSLAIARVNLSLALLYAQDFQGAAREVAQAARLLPGAPQPHFILGLLARAENRMADARRAFERVRQIDASDVGASVNLGQMYLEEQQYSQAIATLAPAVAAEPFNVSAAYNLGLALSRGGRAEEGAAMLSRAQSLRATGYAVTYGTGYLEQGRYAEAMSSTGAEPELVDAAVPVNTFTAAAVGSNAEQLGPAASPFGRQYTAGDLTPAGASAIAVGLGGGLALIDIENDGTLDLFAATSDGQRLLRNGGQARWTDVTAISGLERAPPNTVPIGCVAADYDNDGFADLFVLRYGLSTLYHNDGNGRFSDVTARAGLPPYRFLPGAAAWVDVDHDGDLDLFIAGLADITATRTSAADRTLTFPRDFVPAPVQLLRNNGDGTFADQTAAARLEAATHAIAIVPTDFDNRRDVDLLIVNRDTPPQLFQNLRGGTFRDVAAEVGLTAFGTGSEIAAIAAADVNQDDFPDFFFAGAGGGAFALSDGRGHFATIPAPDGARTALAAQLLDYDSDGLLDLLTWSVDRPRVFRNLGTRWSDVSGSAFPGVAGPSPSPTSARGLALADLSGDGHVDLVTGGGASLTVWRSGNTGGGQTPRQSLRVSLKGRVSNRLGVGSKVQVRAGSLRARIETSSATPAVAPADVLFGLGTRAGVDALRVLWPSGVLQAEAADATTPLPSPLVVEELDRKPSSCPFLFTWNGERFEFVTDFMGGGEMGAWAGAGIYNTPDPLEYVRIRGDQLRSRNGRFSVKVTSELEEALFVDRIQLLAIAHPPEVSVYPDEGLTSTPKPFRLVAVRDERVPRAVDDHGHDVSDRIAHVDRRYPDDFALERFRGYAAPHALALDLAPVDARPVLLLTGSTDYAFSSDNVAAQQAGLSLAAPSLQVKDTAGRWRTVIPDIGIPVGRPQTVPVDLTGRLRPGEHEVRIVTNMRIYWDRIAVAAALPDAGLQSTPLDPLSATLGARGFSAELRPDGREPARYDYSRVSQAAQGTMWKAMPGRYTREGDVRPLVIGVDDMFVVARPGDEIAIDFDAAAAGGLPEGWTRTYLLLADGFSKEMDINSGSPDVVGPLPFHAMTRYPYHEPERYPDTPAHRDYQETYNTRVVVRTVPSLAHAEAR